MSTLTAFRRRASLALADTQLRRNLRTATTKVLAKRQQFQDEIPDYDTWRSRVAEIRRTSYQRMDELLAQARGNLEAAGITVHLAEDAAQAREMVAGIAADHNAQLVVKGKSMLSEEIGLTPHLQEQGLEVLETDLGEYIVQLLDQPPSHITAPALHLNRKQIGRLFADQLGADYTEVPEELTEIARRQLRRKFLTADLGISGGNFVVAETGTLVLVENEGNIGLCTTMPPVHIALTGIEKIIPRLTDLDPLNRLLPVNGTGQRATTYLSLLNGPAPDGCGPQEIHLILVDNGRSALARSSQAEILACIRCGTCLNVCPIFRHLGGHAYGSVYPGPMGQLLTPWLLPESHQGSEPWRGVPAGGGRPWREISTGENGHHPGNSLSDLCALCGACGELCPAEIPLPELILAARGDKELAAPLPQKLAFKTFGRLSRHPRLFRWAGGIIGRVLRQKPGPLTRRLTAPWSTNRHLPTAPRVPFHVRMKKRYPGRMK